jgi:integrase
MTDLRVVKRKKNYVIQDYDDGRKQIKKDSKALLFKYKKKAKAYAKELEGAVQRKEIKLVDRHKFMDKFKEYGLVRIEQAEMEGSRDTVHGVSGYKSFHNKYLTLYFPEDKYLDEIDGSVLEDFVKELKKAKVPYKTCTRIIQHIHTFLRWCMFKKLHLDFASALEWKIGEHGSSYLFPDNDEELYETEAQVITPEEASKVLSYVEKHKDRSRADAIAFGIFTMLACFGLRSSEIRGLKKTSFNFETRTVSIKGAFHARTGYANRTKNRGSNRTLDFTMSQSKHIKWFYDYMFELRPHNKYLFTSTRGHNPIGEYVFRKTVYRTYEAVGLAKLRWFTQANTEQYEVLECRFKDGPTKTWRHYNATSLINNMRRLGLTPNYVKERIGHTRWSTTEDRYGNHNDRGNAEIRQERAAKVEAALGYYDNDDWSENTNGLDKDDLLLNP